MITSKQRAKLRGIANSLKTTVYIGKNGLTEDVVGSLKDAIIARELVKCEILENSSTNPKDAAIDSAQALNCEIVQIIGRKFILYRKNLKKKDGIKL